MLLGVRTKGERQEMAMEEKTKYHVFFHTQTVDMGKHIYVYVTRMYKRDFCLVRQGTRKNGGDRMEKAVTGPTKAMQWYIYVALSWWHLWFASYLKS